MHTAPLSPPPSYEMAAGGPKEIPGKKGTFGTTMYAPRYPYYNPETMGTPGQDGTSGTTMYAPRYPLTNPETTDWNVDQQAGTSSQGQAPVVSQPQPQQHQYQQQGHLWTLQKSPWQSIQWCNKDASNH